MAFIMREASDRQKVIDAVNSLDMEKDWQIVISQWKEKRSSQANRYYWGVVMKLIHDHTGHETDDLHTWFLGEKFGWEEYEVLGKRKVRPARGTSDMNGEQFHHYVEWVRQYATSNLGLIIPDPNEIITTEEGA